MHSIVTLNSQGEHSGLVLFWRDYPSFTTEVRRALLSDSEYIGSQDGRKEEGRRALLAEY